MTMALVALGVAAGQALGAGDYFRPELSYEDGLATLTENPARGLAPGGWVTFKPEGLPNWHGQGGFRSSLWELSRFSGGREQDGRRPTPAERTGDADIPLTAAMKADVARFLTETREKGGSLIIRLGYTWSEQKGCEPADFDILLGHVRDLAAIMAGFADVVVAVEAGVAGPWGEMHSSDYCKPAYMNRILGAYCAALPEAVSVLVRAPAYIANFDGDRMRLGMYNDGYLGTWWDYGTWSGEWTRERSLELLKPRARHPYGGELAYIGRDFLDQNQYRCRELWEPAKWNIVKDWYSVHLSYLRNLQEQGHTLAGFLSELRFEPEKWRFEGMPDLHEYAGQPMAKFVLDHMGYRYVIRDARLPRTLRRGAKARLALELENTGFGDLLRPPELEVRLLASGRTARVKPAADLAVPSATRRRVAIDFTVPSDLGAAGRSVQIQLKGLRFANSDVWDGEQGVNVLGEAEVR
ncbi:MAG: DUF4874 domain-containing protein [Kiritimatiellia bacterium]